MRIADYFPVIKAVLHQFLYEIDVYYIFFRIKN